MVYTCFGINFMQILSLKNCFIVFGSDKLAKSFNQLPEK